MDFYTYIDSGDWTGLPAFNHATWSFSRGETQAFQQSTENSDSSLSAEYGQTGSTGETYGFTEKSSRTGYDWSSSNGSTTTGDPYGETYSYSESQSGNATQYSKDADTIVAFSGSQQRLDDSYASGRTYYGLPTETSYTGGTETSNYVMLIDSSSSSGDTFSSSYPGTSTSSFSTGTTTSSATYTPPSSTVRTISASSLELSSYQETFYYSTRTSSQSDEACARVTTTSSAETVTVGTGSTTTVAWGTQETLVSHTYTTTVYPDADESNAVTGSQDAAVAITETYLAGTDTATRNKSFLQTVHSRSPLQNTVLLMKGGEGSDDYNQGHALWTFSKTDAVFSDASVSVWTGFFASTSAETFTFSDLRIFSTSQITVGLATEGRSTTSDTDGSGIISITNGLGSSAATSVSHSWGYAMGEVGTWLSTYVAIAGTSSSTVSATVFTHTDFARGYATTGARPFTTGTSRGFWSATSSSGTHSVWGFTAATTARKNSRVTSTYATLASSHTVTGSGTDTSLVFLGMVSYSLSTTLASTVTLTQETWLDAATVERYTLSNTGEGYTYSTIRHEDESRVDYTSQRAGLVTATIQALHENKEGVWFSVHPRGYLGFGGSFTQPDQQIYLTTEQGLAAGATFAAATLYPPSFSKEHQQDNGVTFFPVDRNNPPYLAGDGLAGSSLMSIPGAVETVLSVAATWTSTVAAGSSTSTSTRLATHTLGVVSAITGSFHTAEDLVFNSGDSNIGINGLFAAGGGYAAGENKMGDPCTIRLGVGRLSWTEYSASQSIGTGATGSTENTHGTISFTIPAGRAVRMSTEHLVSAWWTTSTFLSPFPNHHFQTTNQRPTPPAP
jgi:hypothetical protein